MCKQHGEGALTLPNGSFYEGEWKDGMPWNGQGKLTYPDGSFYEGEGERESGMAKERVTIQMEMSTKESGKMVCHGMVKEKMTESDGSVYEGEWKDGKKWTGDILLPNCSRQVPKNREEGKVFEVTVSYLSRG